LALDASVWLDSLEARGLLMTTAVAPVNLDRLLRLRLVVARQGEMDAARWWNTQGMLGRRGAIVLERGFPITHSFAQARVVFAVARARCNELFSPPGCMTLWSLPAQLEDQFDERWQSWLDEGERWAPFFQKLTTLGGADLLDSLSRFELLAPAHLDAVGKLRRSAEGRAVPLAGIHRPDEEVLTLLAAGFARGEPGNPSIPYARLEA
jgi:hypothetical protein